MQNLVILGEGEHVHGEAFEIRQVPTVRVEDCHVAIFTVRAATGINGTFFFLKLNIGTDLWRAYIVELNHI